MFKYSNILDINRLYCNSIYHMAQMYGIEAASKSVIKVKYRWELLYIHVLTLWKKKLVLTILKSFDC